MEMEMVYKDQVLMEVRTIQLKFQTIQMFSKPKEGEQQAEVPLPTWKVIMAKIMKKKDMQLHPSQYMLCIKPIFLIFRTIDQNGLLITSNTAGTLHLN